MKKNELKLLSALMLTAMIGITGCSTGNDGGGNDSENSINEALYPIKDGYIRINTLASNADNIWIWDDFDKNELDKCKNWDSGNAVAKTGTNGSFQYFDIKLAENPEKNSFIIRNGTSKVSGDSDITFKFPNKYKEIFLKSGNGTVYIDKDCKNLAAGLVSATITSEYKIKPDSQNITLSSKNTKIYKINGQEIIPISISNSSIEFTENLKEVGTLTIEYTDSLGTDKRFATPSISLVDEWYALSEKEIATLGYDNTSNTFKTWAPTASSVQVLLFAEAKNAIADTEDYTVADTINMTKATDGTWSTTKGDSSKIGSNKYYQYRIETNDVKKDVCDIWNKVASKNSVASQITSMPAWTEESSYKNPFGETNTETKKYNDAIIYEMHITDWAQAFRTSVQEDKPGTFKEITTNLDSSSGKFAEHLKDLGVTHVQILPMFEYAVTTKIVSENSSEENDNAYNWGYNPYNYNTPESRYVENMQDGTDAVTQMREMIKAFHDNNISVIMDVVYNHTNGTGDGSIYDKTFPGYFYMDKDYTGCENSINTDAKMVEAFIIDSLKHWMNDYHINGFRFDLMGVLTKSSMKNIYDALYKIDKNVLVYGEPWTGKDTRQNGATSAEKGTTGHGYGAFDDDFRDAIKGAEYGGFNRGQIQSANSDDGIINGLLGNSGSNNRNTTGLTGLSLHYAECHDNYTLFDKLVYSTDSSISGNGNWAPKFDAAYKSVMNTSEKLELIKKESQLAAAYVILSQGTPFINGGQEFMRTKKGSPDSYAADKKGGIFWNEIDKINAIDLTLKETYSDVYNVYKGLIALRKQYSAFRGYGTEETTATKLVDGVTKYTVSASDGNFTILFNATNEAATVSATEGNVVTIDSGSIIKSENKSSTTSVPAKSFVIVKTN